MSASTDESGGQPKYVKLERWGDGGDLALPLPDSIIERYNLKDGDTFDIAPIIPLLMEAGRKPPRKRKSGP